MTIDPGRIRRCPRGRCAGVEGAGVEGAAGVEEAGVEGADVQIIRPAGVCCFNTFEPGELLYNPCESPLRLIKIYPYETPICILRNTPNNIYLPSLRSGEPDGHQDGHQEGTGYISTSGLISSLFLGFFALSTSY